MPDVENPFGVGYLLPELKVMPVAFSPDASRRIVGRDDGSADIWRLSPKRGAGAALVRLASRVVRALWTAPTVR
jgi:hypothetical protein